MLPSGSTRPVHPSIKASKSPFAASCNAEANSVAWMRMSKPLSLAMACTTWAVCRTTGLFVTVIADDRIGCGRGSEQGPRLGDVPRRDRPLLIVIRVCRGHPLISRLVLAVEHDLVERLAVDRKFERLAHPRILSQWCLRSLTIGDVDGDSRIADPVDCSEL